MLILALRRSSGLRLLRVRNVHKGAAPTHTLPSNGSCAATEMDQPMPRSRALHVVVLGNPSSDSFTHAIADRYCAAVKECGQDVELRDLYALGFDPRLQADQRPGHQIQAMPDDVAREMGLLREADAIIFIYPLWFGMPPAIIKGYVDRVMGAALTPTDIKSHIPDVILQGRRLASFSTSAATAPWLAEQGQLEQLKQVFDRYLLKIFGMLDAGHVHFGAIVEGLNERYARETLLVVEQHARKLCSEILADRHAVDALKLLTAQQG